MSPLDIVEQVATGRMTATEGARLLMLRRRARAARMFEDRAGLILGVLVALALLGFMCSCADPISAARNSVATAASVQKDSVAEFVAWDQQHQTEIIAHSSTREEADRNLAAYRVERQKVVTTFHALWLATLATETAANLAEAGQKSRSDISGYVRALMQTVGDLASALRLLGVPIPGLGGI